MLLKEFFPICLRFKQRLLNKRWQRINSKLSVFWMLFLKVIARFYIFAFVTENFQDNVKG